ncbi:MAG: UTP--glucose-1-phosphate uridylyltransferase [Planctomycetes bacterium]|nr:UTP--glucose-1-phosphate uridylyltransferase [Planctomycetota bacterium]
MSTAARTDVFATAERLNAAGQAHLVRALEEAPADGRERFAARLAGIDWDEAKHPFVAPALDRVSPSRVIDAAERARRGADLVKAGEAAYRAGQVAALMVAGGQGTRLGLSGPKGCFGIAPHSGKSIYQLQSEKVLALSRRLGRQVPFLIMTSPMTDAETREFFEANGWFGLARDQVRFFSQGTIPSFDQDGRALLAKPGELLENPDGHGGCFTALVASGELARLRDEKVAWIVYIQVDNILAPIDDPLLVGLAARENADVVTKVLPKAHPDEKVGHLVKVVRGDGQARDHIIEYVDLTPEQVRTAGADGQPVYRWGSPALHAWSVDFLARLTDRGYKLPLHRSSKPLKAWVDGAVREVKGWKNERFIFDLVPEAERSVGLEIDRAQEFAPVKNAKDADSPMSAVQLASDMYAAWLRAAGVEVALTPGARIEISPLFAATREEFLAKWDKRVTSVRGDYYLE